MHLLPQLQRTNASSVYLYFQEFNLFELVLCAGCYVLNRPAEVVVTLSDMTFSLELSPPYVCAIMYNI